MKIAQLQIAEETKFEAELHSRHAATAGKTGLVIGFLPDEFIHVPIELLASREKSIKPAGPIWRGTLAATGQPEHL